MTTKKSAYSNLIAAVKQEKGEQSADLDNPESIQVSKPESIQVAKPESQLSGSGKDDAQTVNLTVKVTRGQRRYWLGLIRGDDKTLTEVIVALLTKEYGSPD